jgi:hypothetical protein
MRGFFHNLAAGGSPGTCSEQCFTSRNVRDLTSKFESTTMGARDTRTFDWPIHELFVDRFNFPKQCSLFLCRQQSAFSHSFSCFPMIPDCTQWSPKNITRQSRNQRPKNRDWTRIEILIRVFEPADIQNRLIDASRNLDLNI